MDVDFVEPLPRDKWYHPLPSPHSPPSSRATFVRNATLTGMEENVRTLQSREKPVVEVDAAPTTGRLDYSSLPFEELRRKVVPWS